ncbi:MAG: hypothetical protein L7U47_08200 [Alphaproteobacteria bacterium]|nr:hypothetical protein [Alphaproteobacteria bacterium]
MSALAFSQFFVVTTPSSRLCRGDGGIRLWLNTPLIFLGLVLLTPPTLRYFEASAHGNRTKKDKKMRHPHQPERALTKLLRSAIMVLFFPYICVKVFGRLAVNYVLLGIAILTPADWTEEEEAMLRKSIRSGSHPHELIFTFWQRGKDIETKAKELELL